MKKIECCHNCTERFVYKEGDNLVTCHSTCQRYKDESNELKEHNTMIRKKKEADKNARSYFCETKSKNLKRYYREKQ